MYLVSKESTGQPMTLYKYEGPGEAVADFYMGYYQVSTSALYLHCTCSVPAQDLHSTCTVPAHYLHPHCA